MFNLLLTLTPTLSGFLGLIIILLIVVLVYPFLRTDNEHRWFYLTFFIILIIAILGSYITFAVYAKSLGENDYYKNTDYHIIQQDGFKYPQGEELLLCSSTDLDKALLMAGAGELRLDKNLCLQSEKFSLPIYVEDKNDHFYVKNIIEELSIGSGENLMIARGNDTLLTIKYIEQNKRKGVDYLFVFSNKKNNVDTVIESTFKKGYNLADLMQKGQSTRLDAEQMSLLGSCYLVRNQYQLDGDNSNNCRGKVFLIANDVLLNGGYEFKKNGQKISVKKSNDIKDVSVEGRKFFFGLPTTKTPVYQVVKEGNQVFVKNRLPIMYHFPDDLGMGETQMYLTTDINDIISHRNDYKCFYQFLEQLTDSSIYKATAILNIIIDTAGKSLSPQYADIEGRQARQTVQLGKPFEVKTVSCQGKDGNAKVSYVFEIRDMRNNEVFRNAWILYIFMFIMLGVIYGLPRHRHSEEKIVCEDRKVFAIETSVYLVLIAFLTVRLVLLWRLHAFPPIENVSYNEFHDLTAPKYFWWTFFFVGLFLICRIVMLLWMNGYLKKALMKLDSWLKIRRAMTGMACWLKKRRLIIGLKKNLKRLVGWLENKKAVRLITNNRTVYTCIIILLVYIALLALKLSTSLWVAAKESLFPLVAFAINTIILVRFIREKDNKKQGDDIDERGRNNACWVIILWNTALYLAALIWPYKEPGMILPMLGVFAVWFIIAAFAAQWKGRSLVVVISVVVLVGVFLHVPLSKSTLCKNVMFAVMPSKDEARMKTLTYSPDEMVQDGTVKFKDKTMKDIMRASQNKWFIENHLIQRKRIDEKSKKGAGFKLDKEFNQNVVSYKTQTRDVLLLRYVIYEHGFRVAKLMIVMLALLVVIVMVFYRIRGKNIPYLQHLPIQSALFLLVYSIYLYLVNKNDVIFAGLDFPFLTLTSRVAPLGLLLPLFAILVPINMENHEDCLIPDEDYEENEQEKKEKKSKRLWSIVIIIIGLVFVLVPATKIKKQDVPNTFSVSMEPLAEFVNNYMNPSLRMYQNENESVASMTIYNDTLKKVMERFCNDPDYGLERKLDAFKAYSKYGDKYNNFIRSAFEKLFETSLINTNNILYVRKSGGKFVFGTNRVYYDMKPMFDNDTVAGRWKGDLLASGSQAEVWFKGEDMKSGKDIQKGTSLMKYGKEGVYKKYFYGDNGASFELYQIPAKFCYDSGGKDVFVMVGSGESGRSFHINPLGDATNGFDEARGIRIMPNDVIKVEGCKSFFIATESNRYFSKRIHYNGKHQAVYPLGGHFMFAYNFDQMLADNYIPSKSATEPVQISLDYDLLLNVHDYCANLAKRYSKESGEGFTVTAVDGRGRIRLLADYNPRKMVSVDPNQSREIRRVMDSVYLNGANEFEQGLLQNRNLVRLPIGPGSTIKVPFYVALVSEVRLPWDNLGVHYSKGVYKSGRLKYTDRNGQEKEKLRDVVARFGPDEVKGVHEKDGLVGWDEIAGEYSNNVNSTLGVSDFIATSNNYYFGSILMLGTYNKNQLENGLENVLDTTTINEAVFPKFVVGQRYFNFKENFLSDFGEDISPALEAGLVNRFGFLTTKDADNLIRYYDREPVMRLLQGGRNKNVKVTGGNALYVYTVKPQLLRSLMYKSVETDKQEIYKRHFNLTSGGLQEMENITPLNMTEMYLRIALQKRSGESMMTYRDDAPKVIPNTKGLSDSTINDFPEKMRVTYDGMRRVMEKGGTLSGKVGKKLKKEMERNGIYLYAKTGTATVGSANNYHYAYILSNKRIDEKGCDRSDLKVYVVYMGFYGGEMGHKFKDEFENESPRDVFLRQIINSKTFQDYWNNKKQ